MVCIVGRMACGCGQSHLLCVPIWRASFSLFLSRVLINKELNATQLQMRIPLISVSRIHKLQRRQCNVPVSLAKLMQRAIFPLNALANVFPFHRCCASACLWPDFLHSSNVLDFALSSRRLPTLHSNREEDTSHSQFFKSTLWTSWPKQKLEPKCPPCEM